MVVAELSDFFLRAKYFYLIKVYKLTDDMRLKINLCQLRLVYSMVV